MQFTADLTGVDLRVSTMSDCSPLGAALVGLLGMGVYRFLDEIAQTPTEEIVYRPVTSEESDVVKGLISTTSPIGRALLNKKVGDSAIVVTPNGNRDMEILELTTIHDEIKKEEPEAKA